MTTYPETLELALLACQSELTNPIKDALNPHFKSKYATLPEIRNLVTPILAKNGLYITQKVVHEQTSLLVTVITHAPTKASINDCMPLLLDKQTPQGQGSAITYARRYALCAMLNIAADEDDDAVAAEKPKEKPLWVIKSTEAKKKLRQAVADEDMKKFNDIWLEYQPHLNVLAKELPVEYKKVCELLTQLQEKVDGKEK